MQNSYLRTRKKHRVTKLASFVSPMRIECLESRRLLACTPEAMTTNSDMEDVTAQYTVHHPPRIQLGDAPLAGYEGSETDQIDILWQTLTVGDGNQDCFHVEYRKLGEPAWAVAPRSMLTNTGIDTRIVHQVPIRGLEFNTAYEYRVAHFRAGTSLATYEAEFKTRLPAGDPTPFTFAAYGDSALTAVVQNFRSVQNQINQLDPDFALLLGDNAYNTGQHHEFDARFSPAISPEATEWTASHIDYFVVGNHDGSGTRSTTSQHNFSVPVPITDVTAPAQPPESELGQTYAFDYGNVHFVNLNTNFLYSPRFLNARLAYIEADLAASDAQWKIVFGHHPVAGAPDKPQGPSDYYFDQVVTRLQAAGADMFLVGHSHTFSWTYPMLSHVGSDAVFVPDTDGDFEKGDGLVQVISGLGGRSLRPGVYDKMPFIANGHSLNTTPQSEYGFASIEVTPTQLSVKYIAADDGQVVSQFTITDSQKKTPISQVFAKGTTWAPEFQSLAQQTQGHTSTLGFEIIAGEGQRKTLPYSDIDQISVVFAEEADTFAIQPVNYHSLRIVETATGRAFNSVEDSFQYDTTTRTGTWRFTEPLPSGAFALEMTESFQNPAMVEPPDRERVFFPFGVLHGDVNGDRQLNVDDIDALYRSVGQQSLSTPIGREIIDASTVDQFVTEIARTVPGDTDLDGDVDFADFLILATWFQQGTTWSQGDFNLDGAVEFDDFLILANQFGFVRGE